MVLWVLISGQLRFLVPKELSLLRKTSSAGFCSRRTGIRLGVPVLRTTRLVARLG